MIWAGAISAACFGVLVLLLTMAFFRQIRTDLYSYNTIIYAGFAVFTLSLFVTHVYIAVIGFLHPSDFHFMQILYTLVHSSKNYMFITSPVLIVFSAALFVSNIALIRHEGLRFANLLGIILAVMLVAGEAVVAALDFRSAFSSDNILARNLLVNTSAVFYLYFECMMVGAITADIIAAKRTPDKNKDFLIVLGCGLRKDGTPTPLLKGRLDLAADFYNSQTGENGKPAKIIVSGGQGKDEPVSEASSMRDYLIGRGIPDDCILTEGNSADTAENMRFSADIVKGEKPEAETAFFTTNYHVFRAGLMADMAGLKSEGMGAPTRWYFWPNAAVREFIGLLTEQKGKQAGVLIMLLALYAYLTFRLYC